MQASNSPLKGNKLSCFFHISSRNDPCIWLYMSMHIYTYTRPCMYILEKAMALHSSSLAWKIPWMEEPGGLQSTGSLRVGHDWAASLSLFTFMHWRRKWQLTPVFLPGESQGRGTWWAAVYGVAQSQTWLKRLSSSSKLNKGHFIVVSSLFSIAGEHSTFAFVT